MEQTNLFYAIIHNYVKRLILELNIIKASHVEFLKPLKIRQLV